MAGKNDISDQKTDAFQTLRKRAEETLVVGDKPLKDMSALEMSTLIHELHIHQVELEMQNEELRKSQAETERSRKAYQDLWELSPVGYLTVDFAGRVTGVNRAGQRLFGRPENALLNERFATLMTPENPVPVHLMLERAADTGITEKQEVRILKPDDSANICLLEIGALGDEPGRKQIQAVLTDITKQKRAEDDLRKNEQEKIAILDSLVEHVVYYDRKMKVLWANEAAYESIHMKREDLLGQNCHEIWADRRTPCEDCPVIKARDTGQPQMVEKMTPDGRWWYIKGHPVQDSNGHVTGMTELTLDITERKRAEKTINKAKDELETKVEQRTADLIVANEELRREIKARKEAVKELQASKMLLSTTFDALQDLVIVIDKDLRVVMSNRKDHAYISEKEWQGHPFCYEVLMNRKKPCNSCHVMEVFTTGEIEQREVTNPIDGKIRDVRVLPLFDDKGKVVAVVEHLYDITEQRKNQRVTLESEARYRALSEATFEAIFISEGGICLETNLRATELFGYERDELIGKPGTVVIAPESKELVRRHMLSGYEHPYEAIAQRKDGTRFYTEICGKMIKFKGRKVRVTVVHDIDTRKRAEIELLQSEKRFRCLVESSIQGVLIHRKLKPVFVNQAYADIFGYSVEEMLVMDTALSVFADHEHDRLRGYLNARLDGKAAPIHYECQGIKKDGSSIWLENRVTITEGWGEDTIQVTVFDITDRKQAEATLKQRSHELDLRVKELNCLYTISENLELIQNSGIKNYQHIVDIIPSALRYPDNACACINIEGHEWKTKNFKETAWKLKRDIVSRGERIGSLKIYFLEEKPVRDEGFFVKAERDLVNVIAQRLGKASESIQDKEALRESEEKLHYLSSSLLRAREKERKRISLGLHDEMGQDLAALKMRIKSVESRLRKDQKKLKETCESTQQHVDRIVENVRRISRGLSPTIINDLGLSAALKWLIQNFSEQTHIEVSLGIINMDHLFSEDTQIIIYRIIQEALENIRKHARATDVSVEIKKRKSDVSFTVEDNGIGFDMQEVGSRRWPEKGLGLTAMEERSRILGGPLERLSRVGQGTRISLTIPINKKGREL